MSSPNIFYDIEIRALWWPKKSGNVVVPFPLGGLYEDMTWHVVLLSCPTVRRKMFEKHIFLSQTNLTRTGIISNSYNEMFEA
jgi:hypothetical protein